MQIEDIPIASLSFDPANARKHSPKNLDAIKGSLAKFGQQKPIVISNGVVVAGNGTLEAARALGWERIRAVTTPLTGPDLTAYAIADNRTGELAEWDDDALSRTLGALKADGFDLDSIGFTDEDLAQWCKPAEVVRGCDEDEVPEQVEAKTKLGDLYQLGEHRLLCGDCTDILQVERLMNGAKADMVFTDPPYGVDYAGGHNKKKRSGIENDSLTGPDLTDLFGDALTNALLVTADHAAFYIWYAGGKAVETFASFACLSLKVRAVICWYKVRSGLGAFMSQYIPNYEPCIYAHKDGSAPQWFGPTDEKTVWELQKERVNEFHPTQKPVELGERAIKNSSQSGQSILDLFLGSGSTLIGCEKTKRKCYGMELDPHYCDVIVARWEKFTGKTATLTAAG